MTVIAVVFAIVGSVDPNDAPWLPKCYFKLLTGLDCPGCGATRALHAALHGHFAEALKYNFFLIAGLGYAILAAVAIWTPLMNNRGEGLRHIILGRTAAWIYIILFFGWWIIRNIIGL